MVAPDARDEELWSKYAAAAIANGRTGDSVDRVASEAVELHRRRFPFPPASSPAAAPEPATTAASDKGAKAKDR